MSFFFAQKRRYKKAKKSILYMTNTDFSLVKKNDVFSTLRSIVIGECLREIPNTCVFPFTFSRLMPWTVPGMKKALPTVFGGRKEDVVLIGCPTGHTILPFCPIVKEG